MERKFCQNIAVNKIKKKKKTQLALEPWQVGQVFSCCYVSTTRKIHIRDMPSARTQVSWVVRWVYKVWEGLENQSSSMLVNWSEWYLALEIFKGSLLWATIKIWKDMKVKMHTTWASSRYQFMFFGVVRYEHGESNYS